MNSIIVLLNSLHIKLSSSMPSSADLALGASSLVSLSLLPLLGARVSRAETPQQVGELQSNHQARWVNLIFYPNIPYGFSILNLQVNFSRCAVLITGAWRRSSTNRDTARVTQRLLYLAFRGKCEGTMPGKKRTGHVRQYVIALSRSKYIDRQKMTDIGDQTNSAGSAIYARFWLI